MLNGKNLFGKTAALSAVAAFALSGQTAYADHHEEAAEAEMTAETEVAAEADAAPTTTIVEAAMASAEHSMLVSALQQAELVETLSGPGPFTVFAPTDTAFGLVPEATLSALMEDAMRPQLGQLLGYHVVRGVYDAETIVDRVEAGGGQFSLATVAGQPLTVRLINDAIVIADANGGQAYVTTEDLAQTNGMIHVVNGIVVPSFETPQAAATEPADAE